MSERDPLSTLPPEVQQAIRRQQGQRDSTDGQPFYCTFCGCGWQEHMACEDVRCELESQEASARRHVPSAVIPHIVGYNVGDYSDIMDE